MLKIQKIALLFVCMLLQTPNVFAQDCSCQITPDYEITMSDEPVTINQPATYFHNSELHIYFAKGKAVMEKNSKDKSADIFAAVKMGKKLGIRAFNSTKDDTLNNPYLMKQRARTVEKFLLNNGISKQDFKLMKPVSIDANNPDLYRRIDIFVLD